MFAALGPRRNTISSTDENENSFYERIIYWLKDHRIFASIFLLFGLIVGLGAVSDAIDKIITVSKKYSADAEIKLAIPAGSLDTKSLQVYPNVDSSIWESNLNKDSVARDKILSIEVDWDAQSHGTYRLNEIELKTIQLLLKDNFIDPNERQNHSPSVNEFVAYLMSNPGARAHGYAVSPQRKDYRVTLEGILVNKSNADKDAIISFLEFCKEADEISTDGDLWCWWD